MVKESITCRHSLCTRGLCVAGRMFIWRGFFISFHRHRLFTTTDLPSNSTKRKSKTPKIFRT